MLNTQTSVTSQEKGEAVVSNAVKVEEFVDSFGLEKEEPKELYFDLIEEEFEELNKTVNTNGQYSNLLIPDEAAFLKELCDLLYVAYGLGIRSGYPAELIDRCFAEVHRSNMSKLGEDGKPIYREDGKVLKGPNYTPANIEKILEDWNNA